MVPVSTVTLTVSSASARSSRRCSCRAPMCCAPRCWRRTPTSSPASSPTAESPRRSASRSISISTSSGRRPVPGSRRATGSAVDRRGARRPAHRGHGIRHHLGGGRPRRFRARRVHGVAQSGPRRAERFRTGLHRRGTRSIDRSVRRAPVCVASVVGGPNCRTGSTTSMRPAPCREVCWRSAPRRPCSTPSRTVRSPRWGSATCRGFRRTSAFAQATVEGDVARIELVDETGELGAVVVASLRA